MEWKTPPNLFFSGVRPWYYNAPLAVTSGLNTRTSSVDAGDDHFWRRSLWHLTVSVCQLTVTESVKKTITPPPPALSSHGDSPGVMMPSLNGTAAVTAHSFHTPPPPMWGNRNRPLNNHAIKWKYLFSLKKIRQQHRFKIVLKIRKYSFSKHMRFLKFLLRQIDFRRESLDWPHP